jgi:hypothetical protein
VRFESLDGWKHRHNPAAPDLNLSLMRRPRGEGFDDYCVRSTVSLLNLFNFLLRPRLLVAGLTAAQLWISLTVEAELIVETGYV